MKILLILTVCIAAILGAGFVLLERTFSDLCGNEIFEEALAPDGKFKAVVFQRDCGATTDFSTQISVIPSDEALPNEAGNISVARGHPRDTHIEIHWSPPKNLVVRLKVGLAALKRKDAYKGFSIVYE